MVAQSSDEAVLGYGSHSLCVDMDLIIIVQNVSGLFLVDYDAL